MKQSPLNTGCADRLVSVFDKKKKKQKQPNICFCEPPSSLQLPAAQRENKWRLRG